MAGARPTSEEVQKAVIRYLRDHGPATVPEVRDGIGYSYGAARDHLIRMTVTGVVVRTDERPARYRLVQA